MEESDGNVVELVDDPRCQNCDIATSSEKLLHFAEGNATAAHY
jgi:hypothetical protein